MPRRPLPPTHWPVLTAQRGAEYESGDRGLEQNRGIKEDSLHTYTPDRYFESP